MTATHSDIRPHHNASDPEIAVEPPVIAFRHGVCLVAATAAPLLSGAAPENRLDLVTRLIEAGADAELTYRSNVTVQLLERRIDALGASLVADLDAAVKFGGRDVEERLLRVTHKFEKDLVEWTARYLDPGNPDGLAAVAANRFRQVADSAVQQFRDLLGSDAGGPLDHLEKTLVDQIHFAERSIISQVAERHAAEQFGTHKGRNYEETLSGKLAQIGVAMGCQVERCGDTLGAKRMRHGDHVLTFTEAPVTIRIAVEAKRRDDGQRLSFEAVNKECRSARANREANAAVLVANSRDSLPDGVAFGQISRTDFFVEYDPVSGDDLGLIAALYLARAAGVQSQTKGSNQIDRDAARALVTDIRERIERRTRIRGLHATAVKAINGATKAFDDDTESVLANLARLDAVLLG